MGKKNQFRQRIRQALRERDDLFRILSAVQRRPLRFSQIKKLLNIKSDQLECHLKILYAWHWIIPRAVPNKVLPNEVIVKFYEVRKGQWHLELPKNCKILAEYRLSKLGASVLSAHTKSK